MKRLSMLLLSIILCFGLMMVTANAAETSGACGDVLTWEFDEATGTLTISGSGNMEDYSSVGYQPWHEFSEEITKVVIEEGVTYISNNAFSECYRLASVELPESLTEIGYYTFYECESLKEITIPNGVTYLGNRVFYGCKALNQVKLPAGITEIPWEFFSGCSSLKSVTIPEKVTIISSNAFYNCSGLTDITIPNSVIEIGMGAFSGCTSLTSIDIPDSVTLLGEHVFDSCTKLTSIKLPANVKKISTALFQNCTSLNSIEIPERVVRIENNAFFGCSSLTSVDIPESVTNIGEQAFSGCTSLAAIVIPESVTSIGDSAFHHCRSLTAIVIPENVDGIGDYAFYECNNLENIYFKGNSCSIGKYAFQDVWNATAYYPAGNTTWTEAVMRDYGGNITWKKCCMDTPHKEVVLPAVSVTCTENGLTEGIGCVNCEYIIKAQETIPATGVHTYENGKCKDCGEAEPMKIAAPKITSSNIASSGKPKLTWAKVDGAVKYEVYRSKTGKDGSFSRISRVTGTSLVNKSAEVGTKYYYEVKAVDANGNVSDFSNRVSRICDLARPVVKASNVASSGKIKLTWNAIDGAVKYKVYRATSKNGTYKLMKIVTGTTYTNSTAKAGTKYYYKVIAVHSNSDANSAYSEVVSQMADLARPVIGIKRNDAGKPRISWKKVEGAVKYEVWRANAKNGKYTRIATTKNLYLVNKNAAAGKTYYYKVKSIHSNSNANSAFSAIKSITAK